MLNNKFMSGMNIGSGRFCYLSFILELLLFSDSFIRVRINKFSFLLQIGCLIYA